MSIVLPEGVAIRPLGDRVVVRRLPDPSHKSSITLTDQGKSSFGEVIAVGHGKLTPKGRIPMEVQAGQKVWWGEYVDAELEGRVGELVVIAEADIRGVYEQA